MWYSIMLIFLRLFGSKCPLCDGRGCYDVEGSKKSDYVESGGIGYLWGSIIVQHCHFCNGTGYKLTV